MARVDPIAWQAKATQKRSPGSTTAVVPIAPASQQPNASWFPDNNTVNMDSSCHYKPSTWDIWMLGISIVIGGQYFGWNAGLAAGLCSYLIGVLVIAYVTFCFCTSEITGALPFAGGAYSLARCTLGFYPAFLIGCCEALENIVYVSTSVLSLADMIVQAEPKAAPLRPLIWAAFYLSALYVHTKGGRVFWVFNLVIGFCSGARHCRDFVDFQANAVCAEYAFVGGFGGFMKSLPLACWFFVGVEALNHDVAEPKKSTPIAQISCISTLIATALVVLFITVSLPPGIAQLPNVLMPLSSGFERMLSISPGAAAILSLPAAYTTAFGFMWCYGKMIASMVTSNLLPARLACATKGSATPYMVLCFGSAIGYTRLPDRRVGHISLKLQYRNIKSSSFHNPFGIVGAVYSLCVWVLCLVSIIAFQGNNGAEITVFLVVVAVLSIYYFAWARKRQTFSDAENRVLLVAHVMKLNVHR